MNDDIHPLSTDALVALIETFFGERVTQISRPGGPRRAVYRVWLGARTIIAGYRRDTRVAETERLVQRRLAPICDRVPVFLGSRDGFVFQSDAGADRLNRRINLARGAARLALARQAVQSLIEIQQAAGATDLPRRMRPIDMTPDWCAHFATGPARLAAMTGMGAPDYDAGAVQARITPDVLRFTKSDCRSGNGALDTQGRLRWFDFELSGLRHGAEDMAWLAADEIWPVTMPEMHAIVAETAAARAPGGSDDYMDMFEVYTALQISRRLRLILTEARSGGWVPQRRSVKYDYVGADPKLGARLADKGAWLAARNPMSAPWVAVFEHTARVFRNVLSVGAG